ncbi:MAG: hypothetical protein PVJ57_02325 [Phycisphaerae bacterium]
MLNMQRRRLASTISLYARCAPERLAERLAAGLADNPRCAVTRYLLACQCFDRGRSAQAVRHMMVAHHAQPQFESAALLVFAGLNWIPRRGSALLPVLLETWEEFRRPEFDRLRLERTLLDAFAEPQPGLQQVSPLARALWRLPIQTLRAQIREAILSRDADLCRLLTATV